MSVEFDIKLSYAIHINQYQRGIVTSTQAFRTRKSYYSCIMLCDMMAGHVNNYFIASSIISNKFISCLVLNKLAMGLMCCDGQSHVCHDIYVKSICQLTLGFAFIILSCCNLIALTYRHITFFMSDILSCNFKLNVIGHSRNFRNHRRFIFVTLKFLCFKTSYR